MEISMERYSWEVSAGSVGFGALCLKVFVDVYI